MRWIFVLLLVSCARVTSLNLRKHEFGSLPTKIIWFQVAGLQEEQLAMLRFQLPENRKTSFEDNICLGKVWSYNLYSLRNPAEASFLSQITGKKNIKGTCADAELRPIWSYLDGTGYNTGILEIDANKKQSLMSMGQCGEKGVIFLSSLYYWLRQKPEAGAETFHYSEGVPLRPNQFIYDRTCGAKACTSTITEDFKAIYQSFKKVSQKHVLIVRDFSYLNALDRGDLVKAREILADLERAQAKALEFTKDSNDYLILLTSGDSRFVDMPDQGKAWYEFSKTGKEAKMKRSILTNMVLASGARAENFCGMYEDSEVFERVLLGPKQQGLEMKFINPFK